MRLLCSVLEVTLLVTMQWKLPSISYARQQSGTLGAERDKVRESAIRKAVAKNHASQQSPIPPLVMEELAT